MQDSIHVAALTDSLHQLKVEQENISQQSSQDHENKINSPSTPKSPISRDGYGFRRSGVNTPQTHPSTADNGYLSPFSADLVPDTNGLGWPGIFSCSLLLFSTYDIIPLY